MMFIVIIFGLMKIMHLIQWFKDTFYNTFLILRVAPHISRWTTIYVHGKHHGKTVRCMTYVERMEAVMIIYLKMILQLQFPI